MDDPIVVVEDVVEELPAIHKLGKMGCTTLGAFIGSQLMDKAYMTALYAYRARKSSK
jgi:hypothetical protein